MNDRKALKLALEALIGSRTFLRSDTPVEVWEMNTIAISECVKVLAQPDAFTTPPQRTWEELTQQDIDIAFDDTQEGGGFDDFARAIEATLKRKNT